MKVRWDWNWLLAPILSVFAVAPLANPGYFWGAHDARHSVYFILEFDRAIRDGVLYPRWMPDFNFGYGYPFFNIYPPGAFYLGEAVHLAGADLVMAAKVVFAVSIVAAALTMYGLGRRIWGPWGGLVAAVAYTYVPYRLVDIYVRGALAETLVFVFFPLALWAFDRLAEAPTGPRLGLAGLAMAGALYAHYPLALLFTPLIAAFVLVRQWRVLPSESGGERARRMVACVAAGAVGLGLAAMLILPAVIEYGSVRTDQWAGGYYDYRDHFVGLWQFFSPTWGFGTSVRGPDDTMSFQLGLVPLGLAALGLAAGRARAGEDTGGSKLLLLLTASTLGIVFLMTEASAPLWDLLRLAAFAQFPWRLLTFTALTLPLAAGALPARTGIGEATSAVAMSALLIFASYSFLSPQIIEPVEGPVSLAGLMRFEQSANEMTGMTSRATAARPPGWSPLADVFVSGRDVTEKVVRDQLPPNTTAITLRHSSVLDVVRVGSPSGLALRFYTAYYPGWRALVDGAEVPIGVWGDLGGMEISVPAGEHLVEVRFDDSPPRQIGALVSAGSAVTIMACLSLPTLRRQRRRDQSSIPVAGGH